MASIYLFALILLLTCYKCTAQQQTAFMRAISRNTTSSTTKMASIYLFALILLLTCYKCTAQQQTAFMSTSIPITVVKRTPQQQDQGECPVAEFEAVRSMLTQTASNIIKNYPKINCPCSGAGDWRRIAFLNMSDPNEQCPSNWRLITSPVRACESSTDAAGCESAIFPSDGRSYSQVCGRVIGYQRGSTDALRNGLITNADLNSNYVDGISITHGAAGSRQHIWTFVAALWEDDPEYTNLLATVCTCTNTNHDWPFEIPSFVGNDYFCDTGNPGPDFDNGRVYTDDPLWDGAGCGLTNACCELNNPPWFCKMLPQATSDDLEIRICHDEINNNEDTPVMLVDIYVQ